jgi:3-oxocholest-4-en-26-oyl-CoA dehydrogenase alpha subunit
MDFSAVALSAEDDEFRRRARSFLAQNVTGGWLEPETKSAADGGFTPIQRRIWDLERRRMRVPLQRWAAQ